MKILVNGRSQELAVHEDMHEILRELGYNNKTLAVAVNGEFLPKSTYAAARLTEGDQLDIVAPMQGG